MGRRVQDTNSRTKMQMMRDIPDEQVTGGTVGAKNRDIMSNTTKDSRFNLDWNQGHELRQAKSKSGESARTQDGEGAKFTCKPSGANERSPCVHVDRSPTYDHGDSAYQTACTGAKQGPWQSWRVGSNTDHLAKTWRVT